MSASQTAHSQRAAKDFDPTVFNLGDMPKVFLVFGDRWKRLGRQHIMDEIAKNDPNFDPRDLIVFAGDA